MYHDDTKYLKDLTMKTKAQEIIEEIRNEGNNYTDQDIKYALEDGEYLATQDWTQEEIEEAYDIVNS